MPEISQKTFEYLQDRVRDSVQNFFDDPIGYADVSEVSSSKPRSFDDPIAVELRTCLAELEGYAVDVGLNWHVLVMEEAKEIEIETVLKYMGYPTPATVRLPEKN